MIEQYLIVCVYFCVETLEYFAVSDLVSCLFYFFAAAVVDMR